MRTWDRIRVRPAVAVLAATLVLSGCDDLLGPEEGPPAQQFGQILLYSEFQADLGTPRFVEIELNAGTLVAHEVEIEPAEQEERIESRITAINTTAGTITLDLGGLVVNYASSGRFRTTTSSNVSRANWEAAVTAALSGATLPPVEVRRPTPSSPQSPTDGSFVASEVRLVGSVQRNKLRMLVGPANLQAVSNPPPLAILRVLNLPIQITTGTRLQRIVTGPLPIGGIIQFEARVVSVNQANGTMTVSGGTIIQVQGVTFNAEGDLFTLAAVQTALNQGSVVRVEGQGVVLSAGPPATLQATTVKVEVDD